MERLAALAARRTNVLLGLAFAAVLTATAYQHADAGRRDWLLDCGISAVVCVAALVRGATGWSPWPSACPSRLPPSSPPARGI